MFGVIRTNNRAFIRRQRYIRITGTISAFILFIITLLSAFPIVNQKTEAEATSGTATASTTTLTMTTDSENATLAFNSVSTNGTFASSSDSETAKFGVTTNNYSGYTLTITGHDDNKQLVDTYGNSTMDSITTAISSDTFNTATYNNKWGIKPSKYNSEANTSFLPAPTTTSITLDATNAANNETNNYTIGLGARVDYNTPAGTYTNTYTLAVVGNPIPYAITYTDNSEDSTVANLPSFGGDATNHTQTGSVTSSTIALSSTTPTRTNYTFKSWCLGTVSNSGTTCTGTEYNSGANFGLDQTINNIATLYAVWELNTFELTINFAGVGVNSVKVCKVSGDCTGDDLMGTVSATGGSVSDLAYNTAYYLYPTFNSGFEFASWAKTSGEGTISSTSISNPTYTIGNGNGVVTVTGKTSIALQDVTLDQCTTAGLTVKDARDNNTYTIKKLGDGNCWMTQNLRFTGTSLDPSTSDVKTAKIITYGDLTSGESYDQARIHNSGNATNGVWYNYAAASAMSVTSSSNLVLTSESVCPKGWRLPNNVEMTIVKNYKSTFNPVTGGYYDSGNNVHSDMGFWWSSTAGDSGTLRYRLGYSNDTLENNYASPRIFGLYVRCIKPKPAMQDITSNEVVDMAEGETVTRTDVRDGKDYTLAKINGNLWMTQNLRFTGTSLDPSTSNVKTAKTISYGSITSGDTYTAARVRDSGNTTNGVWYNYAAASAMSITGSSNYTEATESVCPAGWRLPTKAEQQGIVNYSSSFAPSAGGWYDNGTLRDANTGYWWSSTSDGDSRHNLATNSSGTLFVESTMRGRGLYVRCIKDSTMQDFTKAEASSMAVGQIKRLTDSRDGRNYAITRIGDYYIMTENLAIGTTGTGVIPAEGSNFTGSDITPNYTTYSYFSSSYLSNKVIQADSTFGAYYNYCLASAGTICSNAQTNATQDICPANWKMPSKTTWDTMRATASAATLFATQLGGYRTTSSSASSTSYGYYWSSTAYSTSYPHYFYGTTSSLYATNYGRYRYNGLAIRCVYNPSITVTANKGTGISSVNINGGTNGSSATYTGHMEDQITINAAPSVGYGPSYTWTKVGSGTITSSTNTESNTFTLGPNDTNVSVSATSGVAVIIKVSDVGTSNVTSPTVSLNGVTCGTTAGCLVTGLTPNTNYTLTATIPAGFTFSSWGTTAGTIGSTGSVSTTFKAPSSSSGTAATITLNAPINTYTVTIKNASGLNGVSLNGMSCTSTSGCNVTGLVYGRTYSLVADKQSGRDISSWAVSGSGSVVNTSANSTTFTVGAGNATITPATKSCTQTISGTMQTYTQPSGLCSDASGTLTDNRDNQTYTVAKINNIISMTRNLAIGCNGSGSSYGSSRATRSLTSSNSNVSTTWSTSNAGNLAGSSSSYDTAQMQCDASAGAWYNFAAASAGTITGSSNSNEDIYDICPKGWRLPTRDEVTGNITSALSRFNTVLGGFYNGGSLQYTDYGVWWGSTAVSSSVRYWFNHGGGFSTDRTRTHGYYVRCVLKPSTISGTMQTASFANFYADNASGTLTDSRDNQEYTVAKINGNLWMTKNLAIGCNGSGSSYGSSRTTRSLTSSNSNVSTTWSTSNAGSLAGTTQSFTAAQMQCDASYGAWYNYQAATAGTITGDSNTNAQVYDICPKGWKIPTESQYSSITSYSSRFGTRQNSGRYINGTISYANDGILLWISDVYDASARKCAVFPSTSGSVWVGNAPRPHGLMVRCVKSV